MINQGSANGNGSWNHLVAAVAQPNWIEVIAAGSDTCVDYLVEIGLDDDDHVGMTLAEGV